MAVMKVTNFFSKKAAAPAKKAPAKRAPAKKSGGSGRGSWGGGGSQEFNLGKVRRKDEGEACALSMSENLCVRFVHSAMPSPASTHPLPRGPRTHLIFSDDEFASPATFGRESARKNGARIPVVRCGSLAVPSHWSA